MIKLIKNELLKIFRKKSIYVLLIIIGIIIIANTIIGTNIYGGILIDHTKEAREEEQITLSNKIVQLDYKKDSDEYIDTKTKLDIVNLEKEYPIGSWQEQAIIKNLNKLEPMLKEINIYTYQIKDNKKLENVKNTYIDFLNPIKENNWRSFITIETERLENDIKNIEKEIKNTTDKERRITLTNQIEQYKDSRESLKFYEKSYEQLSYKEKVQYNKTLENTKELEYKIYHNIPSLQPDNARDMLNSSFEFYEILIILVIVIISGSIVSEEFNKGTIKLLLLKPHKRWKILLAKLLTLIITTIILILFIVLVQSLTGGFVYGFEDYSVPIIQYSFNTQNVMIMNVFSNIFTLILAKIPMYLLILTSTFAISTISCNTSISIVLGMLLYLSKNVIYLNDNMEFLKYLVPTNWDFTRYLYGKLPEVSFLKFDFSVMICLITFIIVIFISFAYFKNKDIKNI